MLKQRTKVLQCVGLRHHHWYLARTQDDDDTPLDASASNKPKRATDEPFTGNAVQYLLKKADESLDEIEQQPTETAKVCMQCARVDAT